MILSFPHYNKLGPTPPSIINPLALTDGTPLLVGHTVDNKLLYLPDHLLYLFDILLANISQSTFLILTKGEPTEASTH